MAEWMYYVLSVLFLPLFILTIVVEIRVKSVYSKYSKVTTKTNINTWDCTRNMLDAKGLSHVSIKKSRGGELSDNYDPRDQSVNLSSSGAESKSIAAIAVAAHEVGHAYQDADESYWPMKFRAAILPFVRISNALSIPLLIIGMLMAIITTSVNFGTTLAWVGVGLYFATTVFYFITLPIELNASKRAIQTITENGYLAEDEIPAAKEILNAAAWTYVAGLLTSIYYLFRLLLPVIMMSRDD